jgi:TonB family protein
VRIPLPPRSVLFAPVLALAAPAQADSGPRTPTGKWNVDFADAQCVAHRDYGTPGNPLRLLLKASPVGDVIQVAAVRTAASTSAEQVESTVTIDGRRPLKTDLLMFSRKGSRDRVYLLNMPSAEFASVRQARTLAVRSSGLNETFALSQMEPLLNVMDECVADLRRVFNIARGDAEPPRLKSRAKSKASLASLFSDQDYPAVAIMNNQGGAVEFGLLIGEDGQVADCMIVATSGVPSLDSQACALLKVRARFEPARGMDGKPAKDSARGRIVWRMP